MTHSTGRWFPIVFALSLSLALEACNVIQLLNRPKPEQSILTGQPCSPPCWQGITPGVTTETNALNILHTNPVTKNATIEEDLTSHYSSPQLTLKRFRVGIDDIDLYTRNNLVEMIRVQPQYQLQLGQLVAHYGQPEKFAARSYPADVPNWGFHVDFYYPRLGFVAGLHTAPRKNSNSQYVIADDMSVTWLYYFPAGSMDDAFEVAYFRIGNEWLPMKLQQDWKGFGPIESPPVR